MTEERTAAATLQDDAFPETLKISTGQHIGFVRMVGRREEVDR
ncbi:MAG: hypothetical protein ACLFVU_02835 [Phycisphaerae bacterium]